MDQVAKRLVFARLEIGETIPLVKGIFHITLVLNKGMAFGLLAEHLNVLVFIAFVAILSILLFFLWFSQKERFLVKLGLSFILAGCIGNLIDRMRLGFVIDFFDFRIWPVFNIADSAVCIGAFLVIAGVVRRNQMRSL